MYAYYFKGQKTFDKRAIKSYYTLRVALRIIMCMCMARQKRLFAAVKFKNTELHGYK